MIDSCALEMRLMVLNNTIQVIKPKQLARRRGQLGNGKLRTGSLGQTQCHQQE
jgi:hypothetical protein